MAETFHLTPRDEWESQAASETYVPESYSREGFIHCTDGEDNIVAVGNRYYRNELRLFVCLVIDVARLDVPIKYEDDAEIYPHIFGPLNTDAVVRVRDVVRDNDGTFLAIDD